MDPTIPPLYYLMNFNDFGMSMVTLFHFMVVNNWWVTTNMLSDITDSHWPRVFVATFWVLVVLVVANLILANVIEIQDNRSDNVHKAFRKRRNIGLLRKHLEGKDIWQYSNDAFGMKKT